MSKIEGIFFTDCNGSCQNTLSADKDETFFKMTAFIHFRLFQSFGHGDAYLMLVPDITVFYTKGRPLGKSNLICHLDKLS